MTDILQGYAGFDASRTRFTSIPNQVFSDLLPIIDDLDELKAVLYGFWRLGQQEGDTRYLRLPEILVDLVFLDGLGDSPDERGQRAQQAFARAAQRGVFIEIEVKRSGASEQWYFLNSLKGRQAVAKLRQGDFGHLLHDIDDVVIGLEKERPNLFLLYEQNIGMITPMIAEKLRQAERIYPENWLHDAFDTAVTHNARNWAYIETILRKWAEHGKESTPKAGRSPAQNLVRNPHSEDDDALFILE